MPPPEPDPRSPPPPPEPLPAPAGFLPGVRPRVFVVRRGAPAVPPFRPPQRPPMLQAPQPFIRPVVPPEQQPLDILQEILRQQQVLRIQQDAVQRFQAPLPAAAAAAAAPPPPGAAPAPPLAPDGFGVLAPDALLEVAPQPLNALQNWQLQWQQQQQQQLRHLQPFLADPRQARPAGLPPPAPPGAVQA